MVRNVSGKEMLDVLKPIAVALDVFQRDNSTIADAVHEWKKLEQQLLPKLNNDQAQRFRARMNEALIAEHFVAYNMHPKYFGELLSADDRSAALQWIANKHPALTANLLHLRARSKPFEKHMFSPDVVNRVSAVQWWTSQRDALGSEAVELAEQLLTASASSANVERVFSTFGLVQSDLRNRLGIEKAGKLVFLFKVMNRLRKST